VIQELDDCRQNTLVICRIVFALQNCVKQHFQRMREKNEVLVVRSELNSLPDLLLLEVIPEYMVYK
jgi:hypothetical protein